jgi:hypothetical protein
MVMLPSRPSLTIRVILGGITAASEDFPPLNLLLRGIEPLYTYPSALSLASRITFLAADMPCLCIGHGHTGLSQPHPLY